MKLEDYIESVERRRTESIKLALLEDTYYNLLVICILYNKEELCYNKEVVTDIHHVLSFFIIVLVFL